MSSTGQSPRIPKNSSSTPSPRGEAKDLGSLQAESSKPQPHVPSEGPMFPSPRRQTSGNLTPRLHRPTHSDMWSPRTTVIHDVSEDELSGADDEHEDEDANSRVERQELPHSDIMSPQYIIENQPEELEEDRVPFEAITCSNDRLLDVGNSHNSASSAEPLPVSMHVPYKGSISSESVGDKLTVGQRTILDAEHDLLQKPDWSGTNTDQRLSRSVASIPESPPGIGGSRESFEGAQKPTASDLVVLAQEVQRLETELEASRQEVKALKEKEAKSPANNHPASKQEGPTTSANVEQTPQKASGGQRMDFLNHRLHGSEDMCEPSHLHARLLKAERCVEAEREKASRLELKYKIETGLITDGQKALEDMSKVRKELYAHKCENERLQIVLEQEKKNVHALKEELSKLVSASTVQSEDQQRLQHALEDSLKDARQARVELSDLREQYDQASGTVQEATDKAESLHEKSMVATTELAALKEKTEDLTKENMQLNTKVSDQALKIQRLLETPLHPSGLNMGDVQQSSLPDPPSSETNLDASKTPVGNSMELVVLAQEVERLEKELAIAKSEKLEPQGEGTNSTREVAKEQESNNGEVNQTGLISDAMIVGDESRTPNHAPSQVTVVAPLKETGKQGGWGRGLWGFLAGSDLTQD